MRHLNKKKLRYRKTQSLNKAVIRNLATSLVLYESVKTTRAKAKAVQPMIEKYITISKNNDLTARRRLHGFLNSKSAIKKILEVIAPRFKDRKGGYTRIIKIGQRQGDAADIVQLSILK